jgi:Domain of unknown function (DUF4412)
MKTLISGLSLFLIAAIALAAGPKAFQFSADMATTAHGQTMTGKMFVNTGKIRMEMNAGGQTMATIVRQDKGVSWVLMPAQKMYMEMPLRQKAEQVSPFDAKADYKYTLIGPDKVDGHPCKKYSYEATVDGKTVKGFHWLATDLKDLPIKWSDEAGISVTELKNAKLGPSDDALFELPAGYSKMAMPGGMK